MKKNEILLLVTAWIDLEGIMLRELGQRKTNTISLHLCVGPKKKQKMNRQN